MSVAVVWPLIARMVERAANRRAVPRVRLLVVRKFFSVLVALVAVAALCLIWGVDYSQLLIFFTSAFAVIGVAMFAQWSLLSNITSSIIIFFVFPYRIGDRIEVVDKDFPIVGTITEIGLFHVHIETDGGDMVHYPNNLMLQKPVRKSRDDKPAAGQPIDPIS
ncbi:mechanosensitive ion channel family protein [Marinobacterium sp. CAU 1594]|nr:mechanosensitive ion channel family protein [Marinobacterium arenosum]